MLVGYNEFLLMAVNISGWRWMSVGGDGCLWVAMDVCGWFIVCRQQQMGILWKN